MQTSPEASNSWHYVSISRQKRSLNFFTWKNKAGVKWDLIFVEEESSGVFKFKVGENSPYNTEEHGYTEARLFVKNTTTEIKGPHGMYTKQTANTLGEDRSLITNSIQYKTLLIDCHQGLKAKGCSISRRRALGHLASS